MAEMTTIIRGVSEEKFSEIFGASTRQARESYFRRHGVRTPKKSTKILRAGQKNTLRTQALFKILLDTNDDELAEEVLRTWLLTKRDLLVAALEHMGIEHKNGLTESDEVEKFETLSVKETKAVIESLKDVAAVEEVVIYLKFMGAPKVDEAI